VRRRVLEGALQPLLPLPHGLQVLRGVALDRVLGERVRGGVARHVARALQVRAVDPLRPLLYRRRREGSAAAAVSAQLLGSRMAAVGVVAVVVRVAVLAILMLRFVEQGPVRCGEARVALVLMAVRRIAMVHVCGVAVLLLLVLAIVVEAVPAGAMLLVMAVDAGGMAGLVRLAMMPDSRTVGRPSLAAGHVVRLHAAVHRLFMMGRILLVMLPVRHSLLHGVRVVGVVLHLARLAVHAAMILGVLILRAMRSWCIGICIVRVIPGVCDVTRRIPGILEVVVSASSRQRYALGISCIGSVILVATL
jgi:hypothetical protein